MHRGRFLTLNPKGYYGNTDIFDIRKSNVQSKAQFYRLATLFFDEIPYFNSICFYMGRHNELGFKGEELAVNHLKEAGYTILCRNYRYRKAEIDIIASKEGILAIIEVKTRSSDYISPIAEAVNKKKINFLALAANNYILENGCDNEVRFDIITVLRSKETYTVEHIENAFFPF